jgi:hypothetical protein
VQLADPWWVNLLALVPVGAYRLGRHGFRLTTVQVAGLTLWALAFGVVEGVVVVYLRAICGVAMGLPPHLSAVAQVSANLQLPAVGLIPADLLPVEVWREAATMAMLAGGALVVTTGWRERVAVFLWTFALWDLMYYGALWWLVRWPASLGTYDVLFLIPRPWVSQVWFPIFVSSATCAALALRWRRPAARPL